MEMPSPAMRDLARKLLAASRSAEPGGQEVVLVNDRLRIAMIRFTGADGFATLLRRALALASAESPALRSATVSADGRLEGLVQLAAHSGSVAHAAEVAITANLLGLLATFMGEKLTLRLVREACPECFPDE
jgi:hypothetical protein